MPIFRAGGEVSNPLYATCHDNFANTFKLSLTGYGFFVKFHTQRYKGYWMGLKCRRGFI